MRDASQAALPIVALDRRGRRLEVRSELQREHEHYLAERGVPAQVALSVGIRSASTREVMALLRTVGMGTVIPYGGDYWVLRQDFPKDGRKFHYPSGHSTRSYLPPLVPDVIWSDVRIPLVFVEGPVKALALANAGITTIGLAGSTGGGHNAALKRETKIIRLHEELLRRVEWQGRKVFIMLDNDAHTNMNVARGGSILAEALLAAGAVPYLAHVPIIDGQGKMGADDFLVRCGRSSVVAHLNAAKPWVRLKPRTQRRYAYRLPMPVLSTFLGTVTRGQRYQARQLYDRYCHWCSEQKMLSVSETRFSKQLQLNPIVTRTRSHGNYFWTVLDGAQGGGVGSPAPPPRRRTKMKTRRLSLGDAFALRHSFVRRSIMSDGFDPAQ